MGRGVGRKAKEKLQEGGAHHFCDAQTHVCIYAEDGIGVEYGGEVKQMRNA